MHARLIIVGEEVWILTIRGAAMENVSVLYPRHPSRHSRGDKVSSCFPSVDGTC